MSLTHEDVNYIVYRYLQESGLVHSAYTFGLETNISKMDFKHTEFEIGCLVKLLQRGLQYMELEANLVDDHRVSHDTKFEVLTAAEILKADSLDALRSVVKERRSGRDERTPDAAADAHVLPAQHGFALRHEAEILDVKWNCSGTALLCRENSAVVHVWEVGGFGAEACRHVAVQHHETYVVTAIDWSPDSLHFATADVKGGIRLWHHEGTPSCALEGHSDNIFQLAFHPCGRILLSCSSDKATKLWDIEQGTCLATLTNHTGVVNCMAWNAPLFATGSQDGTIGVFRYSKCAAADSTEPPDGAQAAPTQDGKVCAQQLKQLKHAEGVDGLAWAPNGWMLASTSAEGCAMLWNVYQESCLCALLDDSLPDGTRKAHSELILRMAFRPAGPGSRNLGLPLQLATASSDSTVKLWDCDSGQLQFVMSEHTYGVYSLDWSPCGSHLASAGWDLKLLLWNPTDGSLQLKFDVGAAPFVLSWNPDMVRLALGCQDHSVHIVDLREGVEQMDDDR